jgi:hypothetical protein
MHKRSVGVHCFYRVEDRRQFFVLNLNQSNTLLGRVRVDSSDRRDFFTDVSNSIPRENRHVFQTCPH